MNIKGGRALSRPLSFPRLVDVCRVECRILECPYPLPGRQGAAGVERSDLPFPFSSFTDGPFHREEKPSAEVFLAAFVLLRGRLGARAQVSIGRQPSITQQGRSSLEGRVVTQGGASGLKSAVVALRNRNGSEVSRATTDNNGEFGFYALVAGSYTLPTSLPNFAEHTQNGCPVRTSRAGCEDYFAGTEVEGHPLPLPLRLARRRSEFLRKHKSSTRSASTTCRALSVPSRSMPPLTVR